jgi:hypothetical protein
MAVNLSSLTIRCPGRAMMVTALRARIIVDTPSLVPMCLLKDGPYVVPAIQNVLSVSLTQLPIELDLN